MNDKSQYQKPLLLYLVLLLSGIAYYLLSYHTSRENFPKVIGLFTLLYVAYFIAYRFFSITHFKYLLIAGILFRILLLFSVPNLSDDVYRFIWDGRLAANGINPFSHLPAEIMQMQNIIGISKELFVKLNSPTYYTIYPPVMQGIFWLTGKLFYQNIFGAIVFMKCIIVITELGVFILLKNLLKKLSLPESLSLLYILNPLVITELSGNVHFESLMIFLVLLSFIFIIENRWKRSAVSLGLGIATKLIPVLFVFLFMKKLSLVRAICYAAISCLVSIILFAFIIDSNTIQHILSSVNLFFRNFEFNASLYYVVRWIGEKIAGYNIIAKAGPILSITAAIVIIFISFKRKNNSAKLLFITALIIVTTWILFSTTVHPWYICLPVAISVLTPFRYAIIWSFTATLSYAAYQFHPVHENLWLVGTGYIFIIGYGLWEIKKYLYINQSDAIDK